MLFTNYHGSPPAGRLHCSAQCWRALAYATTFSQGISLMSLQAKIESAGSMNFCLQRHGGAGGVWRVASLEPNSCSCCGSLKDALTSLASFLWSSFPGTADSSIHYSGVSHLSAFHGTHRLKSKTVGSGRVFLPSSSKVSSDPLRKEATVGFSSSGSSKSEPPPLDPSSLSCVLGLVEWLGAGCSSNWTWQCLFFCPSLLGLWQSLLLDLALDWEWFLEQLSLSISSSRVATMASTFWWAIHTMTRLHSTESSFLLLWGVLLLEEWKPSEWGCAGAAGAFSSSHPWWSGREDSTSLSMAGSPGGDPGSLCSLYTSNYISSSSSLVISSPTSWTADMPTSGFIWGMFCQQPQQMIHSASFCPLTAACLNISYNKTRWWGLYSAHLSWSHRKCSTSIILSISLTSFCSSVAHCFTTWNLSHLFWYPATSNLWYLQGNKETNG